MISSNIETTQTKTLSKDLDVSTYKTNTNTNKLTHTHTHKQMYTCEYIIYVCLEVYVLKIQVGMFYLYLDSV